MFGFNTENKQMFCDKVVRRPTKKVKTKKAFERIKHEDIIFLGFGGINKAEIKAEK